MIGPNGAGKSTFIDVVSGFVRPSGGSLCLAGRPLDRLAVHRRARLGIRRTFQQSRVVPELTIGSYLSMTAGHRLDDLEIEDLREFLRLPDPDRLISTVDVGTRRLIEIAGCLASRPRLVMLDEPAAGLADHESQRLAERISEIPDRFACAVLLVEHDMHLVSRACDTVAVLDFGQLIAIGEPHHVLSDPRVLAAYLGDKRVESSGPST